MSLALAPSIVASLAALASAEVDLGIRAESRASTLAPRGLPAETRAGLAAAARAGLTVDVWRLRLATVYAPRMWTSDVEAEPSPIATHEIEARIASRHGPLWSADASASAVRGRTDPFADPWRSVEGPGTPSHTPALQPIPFEAVRGAVGGTFPLGLRTTLAGRAGGWQSGGADAEARELLPVQRGLGLDLSLTFLLGPRDTLRFQTSSAVTTTASTRRDVRDDSEGGWSTAAGRWRRRLSRLVDGWAGAGAALSFEDAPDVPAEHTVFPVGEVGLAYAIPRATVEVEGRVAPFTDRITGDVGPVGLASCAVRFRWAPRLSMAASASAGARPGGDTVLAVLDARVHFTPRDRLGLELGLVGRWQRERVGTAPSFAEGGVIVAVSWDSGPL